MSKILAVFFFFVVNILIASEPCRVRVDVSQMVFQEDGMYVVLNDQQVPISSLEFANGEYTAETSYNIIEDILGVWWCYNCQRYNSRFDGSCVFCGNPRDE